MLKVGDVVNILTPRVFKDEDRKYRSNKVISILKKNRYNMYICEDIVTKIKTTITDIDIITSKYKAKDYEEYKNCKNPVIKL